MAKYIFITGGVVSGLGKGIAAASLGRLLKARGLKVALQKFDPYLNIDPGTMNPYQHGEVFVTEDGAETDLDLGHYERFTDEDLTVDSSITSGKVYWSVLCREREGAFLGGTVQVIPHITGEIKERIYRVGRREEVDVVITEIGGTVGDIESQPFLEAIRQVAAEVGRQNVLYLHVSLIVSIPGTGEPKSKPTQHSVKELLGLGIQPDVILCRCDGPVSQKVRDKIALFCNVDKDAVFSAVDVSNIYELPLKLYEEGLDQKVAIMLRLPARNAKLEPWEELVHNVKNPQGRVTIAIVGKYVELKEAYKSLHEALVHGGIANRVAVDLRYVNSEEVTAENVAETFKGADGILVPGGFGYRGVEGKIESIRYARENNVPFFGICLGMQCAVIEFARHVVGIEEANSEEFNPFAKDKLIYLMTEWYDFRKKAVERRDAESDKGGTMRLGAYPCAISEGTHAFEAYKTASINERHRHRYEFNNAYRERLADMGMVFSGQSPDGTLVEIVEIPDHPWFLGCQFHPEFQSRPMKPHPLFKDFIRASCLARKK